MNVDTAEWRAITDERDQLRADVGEVVDLTYRLALVMRRLVPPPAKAGRHEAPRLRVIAGGKS